MQFMENFKKYANKSKALLFFQLSFLDEWVNSKYGGKFERLHMFMYELSVHHETYLIKVNVLDSEFYCLSTEEEFLKTCHSVEEIKEWIDFGCLIFDKNLEKEKNNC
jgi:hypothetical protein